MRTFALLALGALATSACSVRPRMCAASDECSAQFSCVAGRCQRTLGTAELQTNTRRIVALPVSMAYLRRGDGPSDGALPPIFTMGRAADGSARLYLRFSVPLAKEVSVLEAYVLLNRSTARESDASPLTLHAARIVEPWDPRSIAWALQPRIEDTHSAATSITSGGRNPVRVDVRDIVQRWHLHDSRDQGIVIVADNSTPLGTTFSISEALALGTGGNETSPRLELYVRTDKNDKR